MIRKYSTIIIAMLIIVTFVALIFYLKEQIASKPTEVSIGIIAPLTGPSAIWGQWLREGVALAIKEYESELKGISIKLIYEDSEGNPAKAVNAAQKLINLDKVKIIYGPLTSAEVLAVAPIAERAKVVLLTPSSSSKQITTAGDYIFRTYPNDTFQSIALAKYSLKELKGKVFAVVYPLDDFGQGIKNDFKQELNQSGIKNIVDEGFDPGTDDFRSIITKVKAVRPDVTLIVGMPKELGQILRQSFELQFKTHFISTANIENSEVLKIAQAASENVIYGSVVFDASSPSVRINDFQSFYQTYLKKRDKAGLGIALSYDGMRVILEAIKRSKSSSSDEIKNTLYSIKDFYGVTGNITFDTNGDVVKPFGLKIIKNGKFKVLKESVD